MSGITLSNTGSRSTSGAVELTESGGRALKLQTDTPHLVSMGCGRLSTSVTLHPIPQGNYFKSTLIFNFLLKHVLGCPESLRRFSLDAANLKKLRSTRSNLFF